MTQRGPLPVHRDRRGGSPHHNGLFGEGGPLGRLRCDPKYRTRRTSHSSQEVTSAEAQVWTLTLCRDTGGRGRCPRGKGWEEPKVGGLSRWQIFTQPVGKSSKTAQLCHKWGPIFKHRPRYCEVMKDNVFQNIFTKSTHDGEADSEPH